MVKLLNGFQNYLHKCTQSPVDNTEHVPINMCCNHHLTLWFLTIIHQNDCVCTRTCIKEYGIFIPRNKSHTIYIPQINDYKNWRLQFNQECMRFEQCYRNGMLVLCHIRFYEVQVPHQSCYLTIMQNSICIQFRQMYPTQQVLQQIKIISLLFHFPKALLHSVLLSANTVCETDVKCQQKLFEICITPAWHHTTEFTLSGSLHCEILFQSTLPCMLLPKFHFPNTP
jgi:hypothetical protein